LKTKGGWYGPLAIPGVQPAGSFLEEGVLSFSAELGPMVTLPSNSARGTAPIFMNVDLELMLVEIPEPKTNWILAVGVLVLLVPKNRWLAQPGRRA
jgi:hypothetical protein